jgi:hypothetical protein
MILIVFSVIVISTAIVTKQTVATSTEYNVPPLLALSIFWLSLLWLAIMEGGLNCMVGLQPIPFSSYKKSHPKTYLCTKISHKEHNIERFIVGRQYLDLMIVFLTSFMVSSIEDATVLGLPQWVNDIFLGNDLAVILCTIVFGQLIAQINCAHAMLDFINNYGMVVSTYVALCVEASGILHAVYFVQIIFTKIVEYNNNKNKNKNNSNEDSKNNSNNSKSASTSNIMMKSHPDGTSRGSTRTMSTSMDSCTSHNTSSIVDSNSDDSVSSSSAASHSSSDINGGAVSVEFDVISNNKNNDSSDALDLNNPKKYKPLWQRLFFWGRVIFSLAISIFAIVVFSTAIITGNTTIRDTIPVPVSFISLLILLLIGGFMEALQISIFAVKHLPKEAIDSNPTAKRNCNYILGNNNNDNDNEDDNSNSNSRLQSFLVGRQIAQTVIMFMIARIITVEMKNTTPGSDNTTLFGVSTQIQTIFFDSGLLNALVSTIFASLSWRVTANFFPMLYLGSPLSIWIIRLCLLVEGTGICDAAWTLAKIPAYFFVKKTDKEYLSLIVVSVQEEEKDLESQHSHSHQECGDNILINKDVESPSQSQEEQQHQHQQ